jgi:hypothetical protein
MTYIPESFGKLMTMVFDIASSAGFVDAFLTVGMKKCNKIFRFSNRFGFANSYFHETINEIFIKGTCHDGIITISFIGDEDAKNLMCEDCSLYQFLEGIKETSISTSDKVTFNRVDKELKKLSPRP